MRIVTIDGLTGTIGLMRQYQKETTNGGKRMAAEWEKIIDRFLSDWNENGINGSMPLFNK
ncbi:MAG: hypothetical protein LBP69_09595 [Treponema sp.]|jgi:hypothetical protein|nr:hypothetical protein [Treponema sp.]